METVDWFKIIIDLQRHGVYPDSIAKQVGVSRSAVQGWKNISAEPRHSHGERLINLWCTVTDSKEPPRRSIFTA